MKPGRLFVLDFLAPDPKLLVLGKPSVSTMVGSVLSVVCLLIFVTLTYMIVSTYFDTSKPKISQEIVTMKNKPVIDFETDRHFPILFFYYKDTIYLEKLELQKFVHVTLGRYTYFKTPDGMERVEKQFYGLLPCIELQKTNPSTFSVELNSANRQNLLKTGYCFDTRGEKVTLGWDDPTITYQMITIDVLPCTLADGCKSKEELLDLTYSLANPTAQTNFGDYENPVKFITEPEEYEYLSLELNPRNKFNYMRGEIYQEQGFLSTEILTHSFTTVNKLSYAFRSRDKEQITCTIEQVEDFSCVPYFSQEVVVSNNKIKIIREYKGLVESASEIGGMIDLVFLVFYSVYGFYQHRVYARRLIKTIYGIDEPLNKKRCFCCKKRRMVTHLDSLDEDFKRDKELELFTKAKSSIERDMDLVEISKEINNLRLISSILLTEEMKSKVPLYILESTINPPASQSVSVSQGQASFDQTNRRSYPIFPTAFELHSSLRKKSDVKHRRLEAQGNPDKESNLHKKDDSLEIKNIDLQEFEQRAVKALNAKKPKQKKVQDPLFEKEKSPFLSSAKKEAQGFEKILLNTDLSGGRSKLKVVKIGKNMLNK